jgi:hypothetical protein
MGGSERLPDLVGVGVAVGVGVDVGFGIRVGVGLTVGVGVGVGVTVGVGVGVGLGVGEGVGDGVGVGTAVAVGTGVGVPTGFFSRTPITNTEKPGVWALNKCSVSVSSIQVVFSSTGVPSTILQSRISSRAYPLSAIHFLSTPNSMSA